MTKMSEMSKCQQPNIDYGLSQVLKSAFILFTSAEKICGTNFLLVIKSEIFKFSHVFSKFKNLAKNSTLTNFSILTFKILQCNSTRLESLVSIGATELECWF